MKRATAITILCWLAGMGCASAQTTMFTGPLLDSEKLGPFTITSTEQRDSGSGRVLVTKAKTVGGGSAHFDIEIDETGSPTSIDIYGYTKIPPETVPSLRHIVSCSPASFLSVSSKPDSSTYPQNLSFRAVALCAFDPDGIDGSADGFAYLVMTGTETESAYNTISKMVISGTLGGGVEGSFVFKGSYGTVLKPLAP